MFSVDGSLEAFLAPGPPGSAGAVAVAFEFDVAVNDGRQIRLTWLMRKGRLTMTQLSEEILAYSRACERLLSSQWRPPMISDRDSFSLPVDRLSH